MRQRQCEASMWGGDVAASMWRRRCEAEMWQRRCEAEMWRRRCGGGDVRRRCGSVDVAAEMWGVDQCEDVAAAISAKMWRRRFKQEIWLISGGYLWRWRCQASIFGILKLKKLFKIMCNTPSKPKKQMHLPPQQRLNSKKKQGAL